MMTNTQRVSKDSEKNLFGSLSFQTRVEETVSREIYETTHSLLREMLKEMTFKVDVGLSFKFNPSEKTMSKSNISLDLGINSQYEKKTMIKDVTETSNVKVKVS